MIVLPESDRDPVADLLVSEFNAGRCVYLHGRKLFNLYDTFGLPFPIIFEELKKAGLKPDVRGLRSELRASYGWTEAKINAVLGDNNAIS